VITHDFGENAIANRNWTAQDVLEFTQAILTGFRDYVSQATGFPGQHPDRDLGYAFDPIALGESLAYPSKKYTQRETESYLDNHAEDALAVAATVRRRSADLLQRSGDKAKTINRLIDAEEAAMCAAIELYLRNLAKASKASPELKPLTWGGAKTAGVACRQCAKKHADRRSTVLGRWHLCLTCGGYYCDSCGSNRPRSSTFSRSRLCACGGTTVLIE